MDKACETLLQAAICAPSGDNVQPWRFEVNSAARRIAVFLDEASDPSPMNSGQRMSRLAIGAALENMLRAAEGLGWTVQLEEPRDGALAIMQIVNSEQKTGKVPAVIFDRCTNRRVYEGRSLPDKVAAELATTLIDPPGLRTIWIHQRDRVQALADLVGRSDALMLGEPYIRNAFLKNVRFDARWDAKVEKWLPLGSLELPTLDRIALRLVRFLPNWLIHLSGAPRKFDVAGRRLVASSAGVCIITETAGTVDSELLTGRSLQRTWLALIERGIAVQPLMSIAILESVLQRGAREVVASLGRQKAEKLVAELRSLVPEIGQANLGFLMRFGYSPPPTARTGRLDLGCKVTETAC
jgi:hypothetical protein